MSTGYAPGSLQIVQGADGSYSAVNPRTGQMERVFNDNDTSRMYFQSDGGMPASAAPASRPEFHSDNSSTWDNFMERVVLGGLGALGGVAGGALLGGEAAVGGAGAAGAEAGGAAAGGMSAADAAALGGMTEGVGAGSAAAGGTAAGASGAAAAGGAEAATMPSAIPELDPTFGGTLTQTGAGQYENLLGQFGTTGGAAAGASGAASGLSGLLNPNLIGAGLGGLLGGMSGSKPAGTTTTTQDIPEWLKPYVMGNLALGGTARDSLLAGPNATSAAMPGYINTVNGAYLDPASNPWLDATYKHAAGLVGAGVDSRFEAAGRYGSGAHQGTLQEGFNNLATNIFGGNYQAERARQNAAITGAPGFDTNTAAARFAPLTNYSSLFPNVHSTTAPYFQNQGAGILGGALAGSQLAKLWSGG